MAGDLEEKQTFGPALVGVQRSMKLPPFQQSKHWPGRSRSMREKSPAKDSHKEPQDKPEIPVAAVDTDTKALPATPPIENQQPSNAANDSSSIAAANPLCGLPTMTALADLKNRHSIKTHIAVRRWLSRSGTIGHIQPVSSQDKQGKPYKEKRSSFPRRMQSIGHKLGQKRKINEATTCSASNNATKETTATEALEQDRSQNKKSSNRLSQSLIPNGDTCDFEQEMNREYPKIKQKHFGDVRGVQLATDSSFGNSAFITRVEIVGKRPSSGKSIEMLRPRQRANEPIPTIEVCESTPQKLPITPPAAANSRAKMSLPPPPRTSSRTATDAALTTRHARSDGSPRPRGIRNVLSGRSLRRKSGGLLEPRQPSNGSKRITGDLRTAASKDTLAEIEAQVGGCRKKSSCPTGSAIESPGSAFRTTKASGNPPERPLPELPFGSPQKDAGPGPLFSEHKVTRSAVRAVRSMPESGCADDVMVAGSVSGGRSGLAAEVSRPPSTAVRVRGVADSEKLCIDPDHAKLDSNQNGYDLRSPSSVYSQESFVSAHSPPRSLKSTRKSDRADKVRERKRRDLTQRLPRHHYRISEEDEGDSTDLADRFPPVPSSRATSRSRSRGHGRHPSVTSSVHARDRRNSSARAGKSGFPQHLGRSNIMVIADTNPLTAMFSASTRSPSPSVASLKALSPPRRIQKKTSRRSMRSTHSAQSAKASVAAAFPSSLGAIAHTPPSSASSDSTGGTEEADKLSVRLEEARAVPVLDRVRTTVTGTATRPRNNDTASALSATPAEGFNGSPGRNLHLVRQASKFSTDACTQDLLDYITTELDAVKKAVNVDIGTLTAERDMVMSENAKLMALLMESHRSQYRQATTGTRELESAFAELPRSRVSLVKPSPSSTAGVWKVDRNRVSWSSSRGERTSLLTDQGRPISGTSHSSSTATVARRPISHVSQETTTSYATSGKSSNLDRITERDSLDVPSGCQRDRDTLNNDSNKSPNPNHLAPSARWSGTETQASHPPQHSEETPTRHSNVGIGIGTEPDIDTETDDRRVSRTMRDTNQMDAMLMTLLPVTYAPSTPPPPQTL